MFLVGKDLRGVENRGKERVFKTWEKCGQPTANKQVRAVRLSGFGRRFGRNGLWRVEVSVQSIGGSLENEVTVRARAQMALDLRLHAWR
jgi:hypothetical protein